MSEEIDDVSQHSKSVTWLLDNGLRLIALIAGLALALFLSLGYLPEALVKNFSSGFIVLSLLLIAMFVWLVAYLLSHNQASLAELRLSMQQHLKLKESEQEVASSQQALEQKQQAQAQLEFVQAERLYLIEKAQLQPVFRATARAFITPSVDQESQEEVWDEDAFIAKHFSEPDLFGVKLTFRQKSNTLFSHERLIFDRSSRPSDRPGSETNEAYVAPDEKEKPVYIIPLDELPNGTSCKEFLVYYVYKDLTSLSVVMKFRVYQAIENDANFWSIENLDICFTSTYHEELQLDSVAGCEQLFTKKYADPLASTQ